MAKERLQQWLAIGRHYGVREIGPLQNHIGRTKVASKPAKVPTVPIPANDPSHRVGRLHHATIAIRVGNIHDALDLKAGHLPRRVRMRFIVGGHEGVPNRTDLVSGQRRQQQRRRAVGAQNVADIQLSSQIHDHLVVGTIPTKRGRLRLTDVAGKVNRCSDTGIRSTKGLKVALKGTFQSIVISSAGKAQDSCKISSARGGDGPDGKALVAGAVSLCPIQLTPPSSHL